MSSEHHFLEPYLMRDVIRDMVLKDILIRRVKPALDKHKRGRRNLLKWYKQHFGREM